MAETEHVHNKSFVNTFAWIQCSFNRFQCNPKPHACSRETQIERRPNATVHIPHTLLNANRSCLIFSRWGSFPCRLNLNFIILKPNQRNITPRAVSNWYQFRQAWIGAEKQCDPSCELQFLLYPLLKPCKFSAVCLCSLTTGQVHRNHVLGEPIRSQEYVTNSPNHAHDRRASGKHGSGVGWISFTHTFELPGETSQSNHAILVLLIYNSSFYSYF